MFYPNDPIKSPNITVALQLVEKPLRQTCYYKSTLEFQYQILEVESARLNGNIEIK